MFNDQQRTGMWRLAVVPVVVPSAILLVTAVVWRANHQGVQAHRWNREIFNALALFVYCTALSGSVVFEYSRHPVQDTTSRRTVNSITPSILTAK
jgi:hypothetical protein